MLQAILGVVAGIVLERKLHVCDKVKPLIANLKPALAKLLNTIKPKLVALVNKVKAYIVAKLHKK